MVPHVFRETKYSIFCFLRAQDTVLRTNAGAGLVFPPPFFYQLIFTILSEAVSTCSLDEATNTTMGDLFLFAP